MVGYFASNVYYKSTKPDWCYNALYNIGDVVSVSKELCGGEKDDIVLAEVKAVQFINNKYVYTIYISGYHQSYIDVVIV